MYMHQEPCSNCICSLYTELIVKGFLKDLDIKISCACYTYVTYKEAVQFSCIIDLLTAKQNFDFSLKVFLKRNNKSMLKLYTDLGCLIEPLTISVIVVPKFSLMVTFWYYKQKVAAWVWQPWCRHMLMTTISYWDEFGLWKSL